MLATRFVIEASRSERNFLPLMDGFSRRIATEGVTSRVDTGGLRVGRLGSSVVVEEGVPRCLACHGVMWCGMVW